MTEPVYRAPIYQMERMINAPEDNNPDANKPRTRCGYLVPEAYKSYELALAQQGSIATGKALHFAADMVCSGGLDIWIRGAYAFAIEHIGIASPRIFVYLREKIGELDRRLASLPADTFYTYPDVQSNIAETVIVIQLCPKRSKIVWPKVDQSTHRPGWVKGVAAAPEKSVTRKIWSAEGDHPDLYLITNEFCKAIEDGSSEKALFWLRWSFEQDAAMKKVMKGAIGLSSKDRAAAQTQGKARNDIGHYFATVLKEMYRELAARQLVRMHEEFAELYRLWSGGEHRMPARLRRECLGWMTLICCEVPKWKVPAAQTLVADPIRLARAVGQAGTFFKEVLAFRPLPVGKELKAAMTKEKRVKKDKKLSEREQKDAEIEDRFSAYDAAMEAFLNR